MESTDENRETVIKNVHVPAEQEVITLNDLERNYQPQAVSKDAYVQTEQTAITPDDEEINVRQHLLSKDTRDQIDVVVAVKDSMIKNHRIIEADSEKPNLTGTKIINGIVEQLDPIVEYAEEPLLSLVEACAPLTNILHDLSKYVHMALTETPQEPSDGLTIDESAAIRLYTTDWDKPHRSLCWELNRTLKEDSRENLRPYFKYMKLFLTALIKLPCVPPVTVWRGVTKDMSAEFPPGTPATWWAFSTCTTSLSVLENNMYLGNSGDRTLFSVEAINGRTIRAHSQLVTEDEILLMPGTRMIAQSQFTPAPGLHIIHLKQVIPEEKLLELPFKGAHLYPKIRRHWYRKKRFVIPVCLLTILIIIAIILRSVFGTRSGAN